MRNAPALLDRFGTADGQIERPFDVEGWVRPASVEMAADGRLIFTFAEPFKALRADAGMLNGFLALVNARDNQILHYARRWGSLLKPALQPGTQKPYVHDGTAFDNVLQGTEEAETPDLWRSYARRVKGICELAAQVQDIDEKHGSEPLAGGDQRERKSKTDALSGEMNWLASDVQLQLAWDRGQSALRLRVNTLFGALGAELMIVLARQGGIRGFCRECNALLSGKRYRYCEKHGQKAAWRAAAGRSYAAKREARTLYRQGRSVQEIATKMYRQPEQIERWLTGRKRGTKSGEREARIR